VHARPLLGDPADLGEVVFVEFKREASPIRIKGSADAANAGPYGGGPNNGGGGGGLVRWTAVKPWPYQAMALEAMAAEADGRILDERDKSRSFQDTAAATAVGTADFRECEEWALDGHCERLERFMDMHCNFFCRAEVGWK
jgi:hypothetical protein